MECSKCKSRIEADENVNRKVELLGDGALEMLCSICRICYICYTKSEEEAKCCKSCGYFFHPLHMQEDHAENDGHAQTCGKCRLLEGAIEFDALLGPEIPALERHTEEIDSGLQKKITEIVRKNRPGKNPDGIKTVFLGSIEMSPLFSSPYPEEYIKRPTLHICNKCLDYFPTVYMMQRHKKKCRLNYPPGRLLYLDPEDVAVFEVEGTKEPQYCQSLCLLAKMFLDHKTLYYDVEPFLFYIIGEVKDGKFIIQGYFSKERGEGKNNLSCIVVFPPYRKLGLGSFLIDFSYYLTRKTVNPPYAGGPEQPLSADGERAYLAYWGNCILRFICHKRQFSPDEKCFEDISLLTGVDKKNIQWAYRKLCESANKELVYADFLANKDASKRIRRLKKGAYVQKSVESLEEGAEVPE
ncbi:histone acetyltransferase MYST2 [Nematocida major]|uniref:histone acetyltransferase MYST2 n=1 Tax=Nematocida major TaxID=1912982 RepID=UPI002007E948|nr:histone acetyltransferase MYST2 [Nematocida major]KAH9387446.1 histone acetyltransferase MYST2 [Nematocida major]